MAIDELTAVLNRENIQLNARANGAIDRLEDLLADLSLRAALTDDQYEELGRVRDFLATGECKPG